METKSSERGQGVKNENPSATNPSETKGKSESTEHVKIPGAVTGSVRITTSGFGLP